MPFMSLSGKWCSSNEVPTGSQEVGGKEQETAYQNGPVKDGDTSRGNNFFFFYMNRQNKVHFHTVRYISICEITEFGFAGRITHTVSKDMKQINKK